MEKIKFKTNMFEKILPIIFLIIGLIILYGNNNKLLGIILIIASTYTINSSEISSIKKYLNERRK